MTHSDSQRLPMLLVAYVFLTAGPLTAQVPGPCGGNKAETNACLLPNIGFRAGDGIFPPNRTVPPFSAGTQVFATQLSTSAPLPSPASGIIFKTDRAGVQVPVSQTFGPIL